MPLSLNHRTLQPWQFLSGFIAISLLGGLSFGLARMITALYALELGVSTTTLGLIAAAQSLGLLVMALPMGLWVEHYGPYRLFMVGSLLAGLLYSITPLVPSPVWLLLCTALVSFCLPCRFVALNTLFMAQLSRIGEAKAGWMRANSLIGMLLIGPAMSALIIQQLGFSGAFGITAITVWLAMLLAPGLLKIGHAPAPPKTRLALPELGELGQQLRSLLADPQLRRTSTLEFFLQAAISFFSFFIIPIAIQQFHFTTEQATHLISAEGALFIAALFFLGHLIPRYGLERVYLISLGGASLALGILGATEQPLGLWCGSLLLGLMLGLLQTANLSSFARIGQHRGQGRIAGVITLVGPAGGLLGSISGGIWADYFSLQSAFLWLALPLVTCAVHGFVRQSSPYVEQT